MFYNPGFLGSVTNLFIFININNFGYDNYANYCLGPGYARDLFYRRQIRFSPRPLDREVLQRIVKRPLSVVPIKEKQIQIEDRQAEVDRSRRLCCLPQCRRFRDFRRGLRRCSR